MNHGCLPTYKDHRDLSARCLGIPSYVFPKEFNVDAGLTMPDQLKDGYPQGCTGYTQSDLCTDEDKLTYKPAFTYQKTLMMQGTPDQAVPCDLRTSLKSTIVYGVQHTTETTDADALRHRRGAYYAVERQGLDWFDTMRNVMLHTGRSISLGIPWFYEFEQVGADGIATLGELSENPPWHNCKIAGWTTINGSPYLMIKSWQGPDYGHQGWVYFSRPIVNTLMSIPGAAAFTLAPYDPTNLVTVRLTIIETIISYMRMLLAKTQSYGSTFIRALGALTRFH